MVQITEILLTNHNRPKKRIKKLKGLVVHWTGNTSLGADAISNRNYFNTAIRSCSAHYIVDDSCIVRCIPDNEIAYHVGAPKYTETGISIKESNLSPNYFLIGIEMCVNCNGNWNTTYNNTIDLIIKLLTEYNLSINTIYRHYDITMKLCPKMLVNENSWKIFRNDVKKKILSSDFGYALSFKKDLKFKLNSTDLRVKFIKKKLHMLGYKINIIDNNIDFQTLSCIQHFQYENGLTASGTIDFQTWNKLFERR